VGNLIIHGDKPNHTESGKWGLKGKRISALACTGGMGGGAGPGQLTGKPVVGGRWGVKGGEMGAGM